MAAYDELYRRHSADARRVARIVTDDDDEAGDVVAEAFARVLAKLRAGAGPEGALTPYLRTVIRRLAVDRHRESTRAGHPADPAMLHELPTADDEIDRVTDRQLVRAAYESLPERWQRVLWHAEIEGRPPAALTPALGSTPNAVAALAYRAREGLRQAFLAVHLATSAPPLCRPYVPKLAAYVRQKLSQEEDVAVAIHLDTCAQCRERRDELLLLLSDVRGVLAPALLGTLVASGSVVKPAGATALAGAAAATYAGEDGGSAAAGTASHVRPRSFLQIAAMSVVSAAVAAAVAFAAMFVMSQSPSRDEPQVAAPPTTSEYQSATVGNPSAADATVSEPAETPGPTDESSDEGTPADVSSPLAQPTPADGSASAGDEPVQSPRNTSPDGKADKPKPKRQAPAGGSSDSPGNNDPGRPPPSPWVCQVLPLLPWCN